MNLTRTDFSQQELTQSRNALRTAAQVCRRGFPGNSSTKVIDDTLVNMRIFQRSGVVTTAGGPYITSVINNKKYG